MTWQKGIEAAAKEYHSLNPCSEGSGCDGQRTETALIVAAFLAEQPRISWCNTLGAETYLSDDVCEACGGPTAETGCGWRRLVDEP